MVNLVLDDLCRPAGKGFKARLKLFVLVLHFDRLPPFCFSRAGQRKAALFCFVWAGLLDNFGVEQHHITALVVKGDDALAHTDHIGRHDKMVLHQKVHRYINLPIHNFLMHYQNHPMHHNISQCLHITLSTHS